jgi:hypothetical protein
MRLLRLIEWFLGGYQGSRAAPTVTASDKAFAVGGDMSNNTINFDNSINSNNSTTYVLSPKDETGGAHLLTSLKNEREDTLHWANNMIERSLFCDITFNLPTGTNILRPFIDTRSEGAVPSLIAVVGEGGSGKTTFVARAIQKYANSSNDFFPVRLDQGAVQGSWDNLLAEVKRRLGIDTNIASLSNAEVRSVATKVLFIVDALEGAADIREVAGVLLQLAGQASVLVTCRSTNWPEANAIMGFPSKNVIEIEALTDSDIQRHLGLSAGEVRLRPFLKNRAILDVFAYLRHVRGGDAEPDSETAVLDEFRKLAISPESALPREKLAAEAREAALAELARLQLKSGHFHVAADKLATHEQVLKNLENTFRIALHENDWNESLKTWRLRHDLIDAHNVATLVLEEAIPSQKECQHFGRLREIINTGFGQLAWQGVIQAAHDRKANQIVEEFFQFFLCAVDNKQNRFPGGEFWRDASWTTGYVIDAKLSIFLPLLREIMNAEFRGEVEITEALAGTPVSILRAAQPTLSQGALSSVASRLAGAQPLSLPNDEVGGKTLLTQLKELYDKSPLRARIIEVVSKVQDEEEAVRLLTIFFEKTKERLKESSFDSLFDAQDLLYIARSAGEIQSHQGVRVSQACKKLLDDILSLCDDDAVLAGDNGRRSGVWRMVYRGVYSQANQIGLQTTLDKIPLTESEVASGLSIRSLARPKLTSDWVDVENYCYLVRHAFDKMDHILASRSVEFVGALFRHQHTHCHRNAATTLGELKRPEARGHLLRALTRLDEDGTGTAIFAALGKQTRFINQYTVSKRRMGLALTRAAAQRFAQCKSQREKDVGAALGALGGPDPAAIVSAGFASVRILHPDIADTPIVLMAEQHAPRLESLPWISNEDRQQDVGEEREEKYTFVPDEAGEAFTLARSAWVPSRRLHRAITTALARRPSQGDLVRDDDPTAAAAEARVVGACHAAFERELGLPGLASVHVILVSSDNMVVEAQRSAQPNTYHPGAWAPGFEEQFARQDLGFVHPDSWEPGFERGLSGEDVVGNGHIYPPVAPIRACVLRGLWEEMGLRFPPHAVEIGGIALGVEWPIMNRCILVSVRVPLNGSDIVRTADEHATAQSEKNRELKNRRLIAAREMEQIVEKHQNGFWFDKRGDHFHPTSAARIALMLSHSFPGLDSIET